VSLFFPIKQATLLIPSPSRGDSQRKHLFILITDPQGKDKYLLMVSLSSVRLNRFVDGTCILHCGDHAFIKHDTFVNYRYSTIIPSSKLMRGVKDDVLRYQGLIDVSVFQRICDGLCVSPYTPLKMKNFFKEAI